VAALEGQQAVQQRSTVSLGAIRDGILWPLPTAGCGWPPTAQVPFEEGYVKLRGFPRHVTKQEIIQFMKVRGLP
jgi:hypothetical protein